MECKRSRNSKYFETFECEMFDSSEWLASRYGQIVDELTVEVRELLSKNPKTST